MFERYTKPARRVVFYSRAEALHRKAPSIETRDLFLGLTREHHEPGSPFAFLRDRAEEFRAAFDAGQANFGLPSAKDIALTDDSKKALAYANRERQMDGGYSLQSDHLLRGLLRVQDETAAKLNSLGIELEAMRIASRSAPRLQAPRVKESWGIRVAGGRVTAVIALVLFIVAILYLRSQN